MLHLRKAGAILAIPLALCAVTPVLAQSNQTTNQAANSNQAPYDTSIEMRNNTAEVEGHISRAIAILDQINQLIDAINARHAQAGQTTTPPSAPAQP